MAASGFFGDSTVLSHLGLLSANEHNLRGFIPDEGDADSVAGKLGDFVKGRIELNCPTIVYFAGRGVGSLQGKEKGSFTVGIKNGYNRNDVLIPNLNNLKLTPTGEGKWTFYNTDEKLLTYSTKSATFSHSTFKETEFDPETTVFVLRHFEKELVTVYFMLFE